MLTPSDRQKLDSIENNEAETSRFFFRKGLQDVEAHPRQFIIDGLRKNLAAFNWLPSHRRSLLIDLANFFSFGPVMLFGLWGMFRHRAHWREDCLIYLFFLTFMLITGIFWAHTSHRVYLDVYWIAFGSEVFAEKLFPLFRDPRRKRSIAQLASARVAHLWMLRPKGVREAPYKHGWPSVDPAELPPFHQEMPPVALFRA